MKTNITIIIILTAIAFTGCKSGVSLEDMQKQKSKAMSQLSDAEDELIELANMKEEYSVDARDAQIKVLEKRQKQLKKDIGNIKSVETSSAQNSADNLVSGLQKENDNIAAQISKLENLQQENWKSAKESINQDIASLEQKITEMTTNMEALSKMEME